MKYEHFGICTTVSTAFSEPLSPALPSALPADYPHDFIEPLRAQDCCAVIRKDHGQYGKAMPPRRCRARRRMWNPKAPERAMRCCQAHRNQEGKAREFFAQKAGE